MKKNVALIPAVLILLWCGNAWSGMPPQQAPRVEVVFALDSTGSMGGLIQTAKEKIWSIATSMTQAEPAPEIRMGLVTYRDRGDVYVTKKVDLTVDLDAVYEELMSYTANGGGDGPESVNQALHEAVSLIDWSDDDRVYKVLFLVGDYPPHMDYKDDIKYPETCRRAVGEGVVINTIQMGRHGATTPIWTEIAALTDGTYLQVDARASGLMVSTPFDREIGELNDDLDNTRVYYGSEKERAVQEERKKKAVEMGSAMPDSAKARRSVYNMSDSGRKNFAGSQELLEDAAAGRVDPAALTKEELPEELREMNKEELAAWVREQQKERKAMKDKLAELQRKRDAHIEGELAKKKGAGADSFSGKVYETIKRQALEKGIRYEGRAKH